MSPFFLLTLIALSFGDDCNDAGHCHSASSAHDFTAVTCGSVVKLRHIRSNHRLHSHEVSYGNSGSGQQSVTAVASVDDPNSLWSIRGTPSDACASGDSIRSGQRVRLRHVSTRKSLHSHLHQSPLSHNQEVSAYGEAGEAGDSGDDWLVEVVNGPVWKRGASVRFKHADTGAYLETDARYRYGNPIPNQLEVYAIAQPTANSNWATEEGIYFELVKDDAAAAD